MNLLNGKLLVLDFIGDDRFEVGFFAERLKAEHLEQLLSINLSFRLPVLERFDLSETLVAQPRSLGTKVISEHPVATACADYRSVRSEALKADAQ